MKTCIYTVNTGAYDAVQQPEEPTPGIDYILFTDRPVPKPGIWQVRELPNPDKLMPVRLQRRCKILVHEYLPEYNLTVYIDANHRQLRDVRSLLARFDPVYHDILLKKHPLRHCVFQEIEANALLSKDSAEVLTKQFQAYLPTLPVGVGMVETGIMIRCPGHKLVQRFMQAWWAELCKHSFRDQLSFNKVLWDIPLRVKQITRDEADTWFKVEKHL